MRTLRAIANSFHVDGNDENDDDDNDESDFEWDDVPDDGNALWGYAPMIVIYVTGVFEVSDDIWSLHWWQKRKVLMFTIIVIKFN